MPVGDRHPSVSEAFERLKALVLRGHWDEISSALEELAALDRNVARAVVEATDEEGYTLLCWAAHGVGSLVALQTLMSLGANPNCACGTDHVITRLILGESTYGVSPGEEIKYLVSVGADPNAIAVGAGSIPLLHFAIRENRLGAARALLECGADPSRRTQGADLDATGIAKRYNRRALSLLAEFEKDT